MCVMALNPAKNGIELTFNSKPSEAIRTRMKDLGFRWHRERKIWYAKHTESRLNLARELSGNSTEMENTPAAEEKTEETETVSKYGIKVGDILYDTWGCTMHLVEFYKVTAIPSPSKVEIVELGLTRVPDSADSGGGEYVMPDIEREIGDKIIKTVIKRKGFDGWYIKINDSVKLTPWDGKAKYRNTWD